MASIAVIGPGAIGGTMAAWLAQDPRHDITLAARTAFAELWVQTPLGEIRARPKLLTEPARAAPVDWVLVATKAYDVAATVRWLAGFRDDATRVAVLQNGVEHVERFAPFVPMDHLLPVVVHCPADRESPGRIRQRGPAEMIVPAGALGNSFAQLFSKTPVSVSSTADFKTELWKKLCINSAGAVHAILLKSVNIANHPGAAHVMRGIVLECIAVGRAEGAVLDDAMADTVVERATQAPAGSINSMHADRLAGRPMEIDARNGVIVRLGRKHGIPTPVNAVVVALLEAARDL